MQCQKINMISGHRIVSELLPSKCCTSHKETLGLVQPVPVKIGFGKAAHWKQGKPHKHPTPLTIMCWPAMISLLEELKVWTHLSCSNEPVVVILWTQGWPG